MFVKPLNTTIFKTLGTLFAYTTAVQVHIPAFQTLWGFTIASDNPFPNVSEREVDDQITSRLSSPLKYYDGVSHLNLLALPKFQRDGLGSEDRINRDSDPVFML